MHWMGGHHRFHCAALRVGGFRRWSVQVRRLPPQRVPVRSAARGGTCCDRRSALEYDDNRLSSRVPRLPHPHSDRRQSDAEQRGGADAAGGVDGDGGHPVQLLHARAGRARALPPPLAEIHPLHHPLSNRCHGGAAGAVRVAGPQRPGVVADAQPAEPRQHQLQPRRRHRRSDARVHSRFPPTLRPHVPSAAENNRRNAPEVRLAGSRSRARGVKVTENRDVTDAHRRVCFAPANQIDSAALSYSRVMITWRFTVYAMCV